MLLPIIRPKTRADCVDGPRPCPFVGCKFNNYVGFRPDRAGAPSLGLQYPWGPAVEPDGVPPGSSCTLDAAEQGGLTLEATAEFMGLTKERVRQIEEQGLVRLKAALLAAGLGDDDD